MRLFVIFSFIFLLVSCKKEYSNFDKIYYSTSTFLGTCPEYYLELSRDKSFKLYAKTVFKKNSSYFDLEFDSTKIGYFEGIIEDEIYKNLNNQINIINSPGYKYNRNQIITDRQNIKLVVQRGGDKTCYETFYPTENFQKNVINLLNSVCEKSDMKRIEKFDIENYGCR